MTIKREAAFHEAGHAVVAHRSKFHSIEKSINLEAYGAGETSVSLSRSKLLAGGKIANASAERDKEVATDFAVVLCAGLVAERLAEVRENGITANQTCAIPDYDLMRQRLAIAGLSKRFDRHEAAAQEILESQWRLVSSLAAYLLERVSVESSEVKSFIDKHS
jgi:ATP-dependent Zn protease